MADTDCMHPNCGQVAKVFALILTADGVPKERTYCKLHAEQIGMNYQIPNFKSNTTNEQTPNYEECRLHIILFTRDPDTYTVVLKSVNNSMVFVFETGFFEASWIRYIVQCGLQKPANP